jgi:hypothetical protein
MEPSSSLNIMSLEWLFSLFNKATYIDLIQKKSICNGCNTKCCVFRYCLTCLQGIEELVGVTICNMDLLNDIVVMVYNAYLAVNSAYGFGVLCQTLDQGITSLVLHFRFFGSSTWAHILVCCLYDPSSTHVIFDGVSIHEPLGSFP